MSRYKKFIFVGYEYDDQTGVASFRYCFDNERWFEETASFEPASNYDKPVFNRVLFMAFILAGISYYKTFPTKQVGLRRGAFSENEAKFFGEVYRDGLSQFVYENELSPNDIAAFTGDHTKKPLSYAGVGMVALQSGGKDSLLLAELLKRSGHDFTVEHMRQSTTYPAVIDRIDKPVRTFRRTIDSAALTVAAEEGGLNGHVPITLIVLAYSLLDAVLHNQNIVLSAIGQEGEEPHHYLGDYAVRHQWAKTWRAEQLLISFIHRNISQNLYIGSPLRSLSELKIAGLFARFAWDKYGDSFSSCNVANYTQGHDNDTLAWCGSCPKCANSFLLFSGFIPRDQLTSLFGSDLYENQALMQDFKGLLGIDGVSKPFECVGEIGELRRAYWLGRRNAHSALPFDVPESDFDIDGAGPSQGWASEMIQ